MTLRRRLAAFALTLPLLLPVAYAASARPAPELKATTLDGQPRLLSGLRGQIVVLNLWATWCGPCRAELPRIARLGASYEGKGVHFVAVSIDDAKDRKKIAPFLEQQQIHMDAWVATGDDVLDRFQLGDMVPDTLILDQKGVIITRITGEVQDDDIRGVVDWLLGGRKGPAPAARVKHL
ncbi:MAG: TlpA family protein disulfide reductase [Acidobacteriota bacterium]|nr:TlpA family protein disulfide reductase [Acidobacteriota bacterium]